MRFKWFFFLFPLLLHAEAPEFYVWQRKYTPEVESGIIEANKSGCPKFYFIAGELENDGRCVAITPMYPKWLKGKVTPVIRVHIKHLSTPTANLAQQILKLYSPWQKCRSLQIDLDAPESKISYYTALMKELRKLLPDMELSATVLPCHLRHKKEFLQLAEVCNFYVLQIHGLEKRSGKWSILDRNTALNAIIRAVNYKQRFKIAAPLYAHNIDGITVKPDLKLVSLICRFARQKNIGVIFFRLGVLRDGETFAASRQIDLWHNRYEPEIRHYWEVADDGAWHLCIRQFGYFSEKITLQLKWNAGFHISDLDTFNGAKLSFDRRSLTLTLPPDGEKRAFLWLRSSAPFDEANSPLTITGKEIIVK
ncbi:MAG: DUF3142 domain-containing protein [Lentisphaerae bacterium]|nr:DUF3142 domain-containing protein [Lentisphaerota bacterium]